MRENCIFNLRSDNVSISTKSLIEKIPSKDDRVIKVLFEPIPAALNDIKEAFEIIFECFLKSDIIDFTFKIENVKIKEIKPSILQNRHLVVFSFEEFKEIKKVTEDEVKEKESYIPKKIKIRKQKIYAKP